MALPLIFVISGPTGVGKTTLCRSIVGAFSSQIITAVTTTTRSPRTGETNGVDYYFTTKDDFLRMRDRDEFLEYSRVHKEHFYGLTHLEITNHFKNGLDVLLNLDVQGAAKLRELAREKENAILHNRVVSVFLLPPPEGELIHRIRRRGPISRREIELRLESIRNEVRMARTYDYSIPPGNKRFVFEAMRHIYRAEKLRNRQDAAELHVCGRVISGQEHQVGLHGSTQG
ncbi:MAG: 50S ribosome-binding GTPase [Puniceicoccales bacterium]|jgi:guanylate kinase|nr:50S ribosome-binding GTPase [Puniceicoccales bacterium]